VNDSQPLFTQSQIEAIAAALADTGEGLTGSEIGHLLATCRMSDPTPALTKRHRLHNAFVESQNSRQDRRAILAFIRHAMKPERARCHERFEPLRTNLNRALSFAGLGVDTAGTLSPVQQARTLSDAERRARELKEDLAARGVHLDVLRFCRAELVSDDYFHAVLEATKSIADKLRARTGLADDGVILVDHALGGAIPMLAINALSSESEKGEQRGFANLVKGVFGMFRNPTAHAARIHWAMDKADAEDLLSLASLIHRRLDAAHMPPRV
jgi:uncharacterized protein (TIGR02391 family)